MFNLYDRVKLKEDKCPDYTTEDTCTILRIKGKHAPYGIVSDNDEDRDCPLWVGAEDIIHVTNVPSTREAALQSLAKAESPLVRVFASGATRDLDENKLDFDGFFSPLVMEEFAKYMHGKRRMADGSMRDSDNWQRGIPLDAYMKSMWRHFFAVWKSHRAGTATAEEDLKALLFNVQGYLHETLKAKQ